MALRINMEEVPEPVANDSPTKAKAATPTPRTSSSARSRPSRTRRGDGALTPNGLDASLGSPMRNVGTRAASDLWDLANQRADSLDVPLRLLVTDALIRALELPVDEHREKVRGTRRREQLAQIDSASD